MTTALERGGKPKLQDFIGEGDPDDPRAHCKDVRVIVLSREACREQIVAQRRANTDHLVRSDLLTLAAPAEHDPTISAPGYDLVTHCRADPRVVDRRVGIGAEVDHVVASPGEHLLEVLLESISRMVRANGDSQVGFFPERAIGDTERNRLPPSTGA